MNTGLRALANPPTILPVVPRCHCLIKNTCRHDKEPAMQPKQVPAPAPLPAGCHVSATESRFLQHRLPVTFPKGNRS